MFAQLNDELKALWSEARPRLRRLAVRLIATLREVWLLVRPPVLFALQVVAALILIFEEWGWQPLVAAVARLARWKPWAELELAIAGLPPYAALATLALPAAILLPLKFLALYLIAQGRFWTAGALFVGAKLAGTAFVARIFLLTKPQLMQIGWFAAAHDVIVPWKDAMFANIRESWPWRYGRMVKNRMRLEVKQALARWRPVIASAMGNLKAGFTRLTRRLHEDWLILKPRLEREAARLRTAAQRTLARLRQG
ncbi:MAG: hypothetical protein WC807_03930 [Hyphomicrobium sp.]|jgi:hypothetical protein